MMRIGLVVGVFVLGVVGCGKEDAFMRPEARAAARVQIAAAECPGRPKIVNAPDHCVFETEPGSRVLKVDVDLAAEVDDKGAPVAVKLAGPSRGEDADRAAIACALRAKYEAGRDEGGAVITGETCPFRMRLARYPTDVAPQATLVCGPTEAGFMANGPNARPCFTP
jgi:hypothetical protein